MSRKKSDKPAVDPKPLYAAVGALDLAIAELRTAADDATGKARKQVDDAIATATALRQDVIKRARRAGDAAEGGAEQVVNTGLTVASDANQRYEALATRGTKVVGDLLEAPVIRGVAGQVDDAARLVESVRAAADKAVESLLSLTGIAARAGHGAKEEVLTALADAPEEPAEAPIKPRRPSRSAVKAAAAKAAEATEVAEVVEVLEVEGAPAPKVTTTKATTSAAGAKRATKKTTAKKTAAKRTAKTTTAKTTTADDVAQIDAAPAPRKAARKSTARKTTARKATAAVEPSASTDVATAPATPSLAEQPTPVEGQEPIRPSDVAGVDGAPTTD